MNFEIKEQALGGVILLEAKRFGDNRGFFSESWNKAAFTDIGITADFVQDNHSKSALKHTLRGLHCQLAPHAQDKLVRVIKGRILDVAVDVRQGSKTYGQSAAYELTEDDGLQLLVPKGFLHGFLTLEDETEVLYKCSNYYAPGFDKSVAFDDPDLAIDWGLGTKLKRDDLILSEKDKSGPQLKDAKLNFTIEG